VVFVDPNGEFFFSAILPGIGTIIDAAAWGAVIGGAGYTASVGFSDGGFNNWNIGDFAKALGRGAISGAVTGGVGEMFGPVIPAGGSMDVGREISRAYAHGFAQGMISKAYGGDFMTGFSSAGLSSLAGSAYMGYGGDFANSVTGGYAFSAVAGDAGSALAGGNFWEGAAIGTMNFGLNKMQQAAKEYSRESEGIFSKAHAKRWLYGISSLGNSIGSSTGLLESYYLSKMDNVKFLNNKAYSFIDKINGPLKVIQGISKYTFYGGLLVSATQGLLGYSSPAKAGLDMFMGGVMYYGGVGGIAVGGLYFTIDAYGWENSYNLYLDATKCVPLNQILIRGY
jgi:hypothetical protein